VRLAEYRHALRGVLSSESKAYGFTLVVWGSGSMLTAERGQPGRSGAIAFVGGLLLGVAAAIVVSFGGPAERLETSQGRRPGAGGIHLASVGAAIGVAWGVAAIVVQHWVAYLLSGIAAGFVYQLVLGLEVALTPGGRQVEQG